MEIKQVAGVRAVALNHVSIPAADLDESERFYHHVFGLERIPSPNFGFPVRWLRIGNLQLHLQKYDPSSPLLTYQHFAIEVDDFEGAYRVLSEVGAFEDDTRYANIWVLPSGEVQMFVRDPSLNLIEIDWPDVSTLDTAIFGSRLRALDDEYPQNGSQTAATLFLSLPGRQAAGEKQT